MLDDPGGLTGSILLSVLRTTEGKTEAAPDPGLAEIVSKKLQAENIWVANGLAGRVSINDEKDNTVLHIDPQSGVPALTAREQQVLELVAQGLSAKETAQEIEIAPRTVERHIENVRLKLRARNRTHMVTLALELGVLHIDGAEAA